MYGSVSIIDIENSAKMLEEDPILLARFEEKNPKWRKD